jgi:hypothetical protein
LNGLVQRQRRCVGRLLSPQANYKQRHPNRAQDEFGGRLQLCTPATSGASQSVLSSTISYVV